MNLIQHWYEKKDYAEGVELVRIYAPEHPLLPMLEEGETALNAMYLSGIIPDLKVDSEQRTTEPPLTADCRLPTAGYLYLRQKELLHGRAITRNRFHEYGLRNDVPAVQARARINEELINIRKELHDVSRKIERYEKTGELITIPDLSEVVSPVDEAALQDLLNARSHVSRIKGQLRKLYENNAPKEQIEKKELQLKRWETTRDMIIEKRKEHAEK